MNIVLYSNSSYIMRPGLTSLLSRVRGSIDRPRFASASERAEPCPRGTPNSDEFLYSRAPLGHRVLPWHTARLVGPGHLQLLYSTVVGNRLAWAVPAVTSGLPSWRSVISNGILLVQFSALVPRRDGITRNMSSQGSTRSQQLIPAGEKGIKTVSRCIGDL